MAVIHVDHKLFALLLSSRVPGADDEYPLHAGPLCFELYACPEAVDPTRPIYHPIRRWLREVRPYRPRSFHVEWREFYLSQEPSVETPTRHIGHPVNASLFSPFHIDIPSLLERLRDDGVEEINPLDSQALPNPWTGHPPAAFLFRTLATYSDRNLLWEFVISLGRCSQKPATAESHHGALWAHVTCPGGELGGEVASLLSAPSRGDHTHDHDCTVDHIAEWPGRARLTGILAPRASDSSGYIISRTVKYIQLSFTPSHLQPVGAPLRLQLGVDIMEVSRPPLGSRRSGGTTDDLSSTCIESESDDEDEYESQEDEKPGKRRRLSLSVDGYTTPRGADVLRDTWKSRRCSSLAPDVARRHRTSRLFL